MKLQKKVLCFVLIIVIFSVGIITILSFFQMKSLITEQYSKDLLDVSKTVSENYIVKEYLKGDNAITNEKLNEEINNIKVKTNVNFIVILDMKGIRHTHPVKEKIGYKFEGGDEKNVLEKSEEYVSEAVGTLGISFRAFEPIYVYNTQVGAVCVGTLAIDFDNAIYTKMQRFIPFIILGLVLGGLGAVLFSYSIKKTIFNLEPEEIAFLLKQKETILENIKEGIVFLDKEGKIVLFNKEAALILELGEGDIGKHITEFVDENKSTEALASGKVLENVEVKVRPGTSIMSKINPLKNDKNEVIGVVINFRNLTEVRKLAEELTGIKKMAWSLRAQNHEFMNKLHTIAGLIQLEEYDEALEFISSIAKSRNKISSILTEKIKDPSLAAILLSKYNKAEESRVNFKIDEASNFVKLPEYMSSEDIISIIGNLIENSLDVVKNDGSGEIYIKIMQENDLLKIKVKDNGPGIKKEYRDKVYEQGFSTKDGQRGYGMYIVKKIIEEANGTIEFKVENGVTWYINIPMIRSE